MAQYEDLTIDQGSDVAVEIYVVDTNNAAKNLSNYSVNAKLKKTYNSDSSDTTTFASLIASPPSDGIITLALNNTQTDLLKSGRYVYDVEISFDDSNGDTVIERILEGKILVTPSVTK